MSPAIPLAYLNGRFLPQSEAALPLHDAGFVMGATVTDFCRTYNRVLFRWADHLARFRRHCATCFIPLAANDEELTAIAEILVEKNTPLLGPKQDLALITFATPGPIGYYLGTPGGAGDGLATLGMQTFPLPFARYRPFFEKGVSLGTVPDVVSGNDGLMPPNVKHRSRFNWWLAEKSLRGRLFRAPHAIPLLVNSREGDGTITETAIGNVLVVSHGTVLSPKRDTIVDGISLRIIERLCQELRLPFREETLHVSDLTLPEEVLICGTGFGLAGVSCVNTWSVPWPGPIFTRLLEAWNKMVGLDIAKQIMDNS